MTTPQGGFNAGTATGYVDIDPSGVRSGLNEAKQQLNGFRQNMGQFVTNTGRQIRDFGAAWTAMAAPMGLALGAGIKAASDFDSVLTEIQARTGLTTDAMAEVRQAALDAGADTVFSSQQAANAFLQLTTAGMDTQAALATLPEVLNAAAAGNIDLGQAADYVTNVMSVFKIGVEDVGTVVDAMSRAAASSPADIAQIGEALQVAGGQAQAFGLDVNQTSAILAIFAQNGERGSQAGNRLMSMLRNMSRDVPAVQEAWDELGVSMYDAQGNARDLDTVFAELRTALADLPTEEQNRLIQTLAGSEGMLGFNALLASDGINAMTETMAGQASAADVAQQMMGTFRNQVNSLMGSIQTAMITAFTPFMNNVLRPIVSFLINATNGITAFMNENEGLTQIIVMLMAAFVALGPVITIIGQGMMFLGAAIGFWLSPIGLMLAAVGGLAFVFRDRIPGAISAAMGYFDAFRIFISTFVSDLQNYGIGEAILGIFGRGSDERGESTLEGLLTRMGFSRERAIELTNNIFSVFSLWFVRIRNLFDRIQNAVVPMFREISTFLSQTPGNGFLNGILNLLNPLFALQRLIGGLLLQAFEGITGAITRFFAALNDGQSTVDAFKAAFNDSAIFNTIINGISAFVSFITNTAIPALIRFGNFIGGLFNAFQQGGFSGAATFIQDNLITPIFNAIATIDWSQVATNILNGIGTALSLLWQAGTWVFDNFISPMIGNITSAVQTVDWSQVVTNIMGAIGTAFTTVFQWAGWITTNIIAPLLANAFTAITTTDWSQVAFDIGVAIGNVLSTIFDWIGWVRDNILSPMIANAALAIENVDWFSVGENIINAIGAALTATFDFIGWIISSIFSPITENTDAATGQVNWDGVGTSIMNAIGGALQAVGDFMNWVTINILAPLVLGAVSAIQSYDWSSVGTGLMDAIRNALPNIATWVQTNIIQPVQNALSGFNPFNSFGGGGGPSLPAPATSPPVSFGSSLASGFGNITSLIQGSFASGIDFVPNDMIAQIHRGEQVVPASRNPNNPNASNSSGGGDTYHINVPITPYPGMTPADAERLGTAAGRGVLSVFRKNGGRS